MLIIGLTGGIGSGKSAVANGFKKLGIHVFDADNQQLKSLHIVQVPQVQNALYKRAMKTLATVTVCARTGRPRVMRSSEKRALA